MLYISTGETIMKFIITVLFVMLSVNVMAMGRLPSDPATWGDVTTVQNQVTANQAQEQSDMNNVNNKLDDLNTLKVQLGTTVRLYDAKYGSLNFFSFTDIQGSGGNAVGLNVGLKLGKSYEQRLIEKQQKQIDLLLEKIKP